MKRGLGLSHGRFENRVRIYASVGAAKCKLFIWTDPGRS